MEYGFGGGKERVESWRLIAVRLLTFFVAPYPPKGEKWRMDLEDVKKMSKLEVERLKAFDPFLYVLITHIS